MLESKDKKDLLKIINYERALLKKISLISDKRLYRESKSGTLGLKIAILFNKY